MISKKICPNCGSEEVIPVVGSVAGSWLCKECRFSGSEFVDQPIIGLEREMKDNLTGDLSMIRKDIIKKTSAKKKGGRKNDKK